MSEELSKITLEDLAIASRMPTPRKVFLDSVDPREHYYLSTGCLHGRHDYCSSPTGENARGETWNKKAGECKFCTARCVCTCHKEG